MKLKFDSTAKKKKEKEINHPKKKKERTIDKILWKTFFKISF